MADLILVLNAGSSSVKFTIYRESSGGREWDEICGGQADGLLSEPRFVAHLGDRREEQPLAEQGQEHAVHFMAGWLRRNFAGHPLTAVGHRVAHGGRHHEAPIRITDAVIEDLERLVPLAPLHQPNNLRPIRVLMGLMPEMPQVACFDTAFHRSMPPLEQLYALPRWLTDGGVRRYGFHGLSYQYIAGRLRALDPALAAGRVVVAHLGSGASMCAMKDGRSQATTMGFTALEGLPMSTRCGTIDPGILLYLMEHHRMDAGQISDILYHRSGLLGVSGVSGDMRLLMESRERHAAEAVELFALRVARELASLAGAIEGLDGLVFTAGVGEHDWKFRDMVCRKAAWLGIALDDQANRADSLVISAAQSPVRVLVIPTDENRIICEQTVALCEH